MASRTIYTSTVTVPVYASWICEHCGEINFSEGEIVCRRVKSTSSWSNSKREEVKSKSYELALAEWTENAYKIMTDPQHNAMSMRSDLFLQNTNCTKCEKKPSWDKDMKYLSWYALSIMFAIISGIVAVFMKTSIVAWLVFLAFLGGIIYGIVTEKQYKKAMGRLPKKYTPVIGSLNEELIAYARHLGGNVPSPDECIEIVSRYRKSYMATIISTPSVEKNVVTSADGDNIEAVVFCRKCGMQLQVDSNFCHKCGTEVIR